MSKKRFLALALIPLFCPAPGWCDRPLPFFDQSNLRPYWDSESSAAPEEKLTPARVPSFQVIDQNGQPVTEKNLDGGVSLVNFFFCECPGVCPMMMSSIRKLVRNLAPESRPARFSIYSFSIMPEHDTPAELRAYAKARDLDLSSWSLLTGDHEQIYGIGKGVFKDDHTRGGLKNQARFIHSSNVYLVDSERRIRGVYDTANPAQMKALAGDLMRLR